MRGPKRASKIRKLFNLSKDDDVRKYVNTYRTVKEKDGKKHSKAPKIQRLVTPLTLQRKRHRRAIKRERITKVRLLSLFVVVQGAGMYVSRFGGIEGVSGKVKRTGLWGLTTPLTLQRERIPKVQLRKMC